MIWILWHRRLGDLNQMLELAKALELPYIVKKLAFRKPYYAPLANVTFDASHSDPLSGPWPKLVICAEALTSVVARHLKRQSGGQLKIISIARPSGSTRDFDLVLTTAQYRLPAASNIVELHMPLAAENMLVPQDLGRIAVLIGATSPPDHLDDAAAQHMVADLVQSPKPLDVITSPRTSSSVSAILSEGFKAPHRVYKWQQGADNPYARLIAEASSVIVTSDSVSMLADALVAGKLVQVYPLPRRLSALQQLVEWFYKAAPEAWVFRSGIIEATTDRRVLVERLIAEGYVSWFGTPEKSTKPFDRRVDITTAVQAVKRLL